MKNLKVLHSAIPILAAAFICGCHGGAGESRANPRGVRAEYVSRSSSPPISSLSGCGDEKVWRVGFPGSPPVVTKRVEPSIGSAGQSEAGDIVVVEAIIDRTGRVCGATILRSVSPDADRAVISAVKEWTFAPAMLNGEPQQVAYNIAVPVRL